MAGRSRIALGGEAASGTVFIRLIVEPTLSTVAIKEI